MQKCIPLGICAAVVFNLASAPRVFGFQSAPSTTTPIHHLVVIFGENISFDHYFGTYPNATNPAGSPVFNAKPNTPSVNGLTPGLLTNNPNSTQPFRLDRSQASTCDNDNAYADEQKAYDRGLADKFQITSATGAGCTPALAMGYYDGNTVTALWNYAQNYAMSDTFFATTFGTTVMGHLNLLSGQTHQTGVASKSGTIVNGSVIANINPVTDDCTTGATVEMTSKNVGDLLNAQGVTWGWFYADFDPIATANGVAQCSSLYNAHYAPFQYWASTANPHHLPPSTPMKIGQTDQANHQYAINDLLNLVANGGTLPAVTFLKATKAQTGHPSDSTPLEEQAFLVQTINFLETLPQWSDMAIMITYDDSDGWYDHVIPPIVSPSSEFRENDVLAGATGLCGTIAGGAYQDRCGYGPRLPMVVISPFAKQNFVDSTLADQSSILRFIEDNWQLGRIGDQSSDAIAGSLLNLFNFSGPTAGPLFLDPATGQIVK